MITKTTMQAQSLPLTPNNSADRMAQDEEILLFNYSNSKKETKNAEVEESAEKSGGFFNTVKNFFATIGDFFGKLFGELFGKKDDSEPETKTKAKQEADTEISVNEETKTDANKDISIDINEKIENFSQGELGDCWFLNAVESLSQSEKGTKIIENAIEKNDDNSYSVTFEGLKTTYDITKEELVTAKKEGRTAKGDDDVILLEIAADKALKDVKENPDKFSGNDYATYVSFLSGKPKDNKSYNYVGAGANLDVAAAMFGCDPLNNFGQINIALNGDKSNTTDKINEIKNLDLDSMMTEITFNTDFLEQVKGANGKNVATTGMHSYSIKSIKDDVITVTNPWCTEYEVKYNINDIADKILQVNYCYLD